jgi:diacylglycerol kinase family enzyme
VLIANIINYAGVLKLASDRLLDDGLYEVYLFPSGKIGPLLLSALRGVIGNLPGGGVTMRRAREVRVGSDRPVPIQVDGDAKGETPLEFTVTDRQVRLLVP